MNAGILNINRVVANCKLQRVGRRIEILTSTTSTNDHVWSHAKDEHGDGYVVFAEHQTKGRGRFGRSWSSPRGASILVTCLLIDTPDHPAPTTETLSLIAGIATATAIRDSTGLFATIAWPNDVVIAGRKVAGVLVESRIVHSGSRAIAIGVGINCYQHRNHFPAALASHATSLDLESGTSINREAVAGALLSQLDAWIIAPERWRVEHVRSAFMACSEPFGRSIRIRYRGATYSGHVVDIDPSTALVVRLGSGIPMVFPAAETSVLSGGPNSS